MVLTNYLLAGAAVCQGITGYWAFHLSTHSKWARGGFALVTLTAVALLIWTGVRTNRDSEAQQKAVGEGFSGLHTDIDGLKKSVGQRPPPVVVRSAPQLTTQKQTPLPPQPHAAIKVTRIEFVSPDPSDGSGDIVARAMYQNLGDITGYAPATVANAYLGDPMAPDKPDAVMDRVRDTALSMEPPRNTEMDPKGTEAYLDIARVKAADWANVIAGKKTFYAWVALGSTDKNLPKHRAFISEFGISKSRGYGYQIDRRKAYFHAIRSP